MNLHFRLLCLLWRKLSENRPSFLSELLMHFLPKDEKKFLAFMNLQVQLISHSQLHQDFLPIYFLGKSTSGYFIEVGVGNGISNSNTYLLENEFGYRGILVEPNEKFLDSLKENRDALIFNCAAGSNDGQSVIFFGTDDGEYSYIANEFVGQGKRRESILKQTILTKTLNSILIEANSPEVIDFLSIDVEGYEIEVLHGLDLAEWKFKVVCIEHNYNELKKSQIIEIFTSHGYRHVLPVASQFDSFFVMPELLMNSN